MNVCNNKYEKEYKPNNQYLSQVTNVLGFFTKPFLVAFEKILKINLECKQILSSWI